MKKFAVPALIWFLLVLSGVAFFVWHDSTMALLTGGLGVLVWGFTPSGLGEVPPVGSRPDPKAVKDYRRENPGATISDGIRATSESHK